MTDYHPISTNEVDAALRNASPVRPRKRRPERVNGTAAAQSSPAPALAVRQVPPPEPYAPFPVEVLPEPLRSFVDAGAKAMQCPPAYVAVPLLAVCAGMIGNARTIRLKAGWHEPCVLWCATVGDSGSVKSPAFRLATRGVQQIHSELMRVYERERAEQERTVARLKREKSAEPIPPEPVPERIMAADVTMEALAGLLHENGRGILVVRDELSGWVRGFDQYRARRGADSAHWLSIFNADGLTVDRKTTGVLHVPRAAVSVCGTIQPEVLASVFNEEYRSNGFAARVLLAWPPKQRKRWTDRSVSDAQQGQIRRLCEQLRALPMPEVEPGVPGPDVVELDPEARDLWVRFFDEHAEEQAGLAGDLARVWSKLEAGAARLALVIHCVRAAMGDDVHPDYLDAESMRSAIVLARWFGAEARRIYAMLGESDVAREHRRLAELIRRKGGRITPSQLVQSSRAYRDAAAAEHCLNELVRIGWGCWETTQPGKRGGRPSRAFVLSVEVSTSTKPPHGGDGEGSVDVDGVDTSGDGA